MLLANSARPPISRTSSRHAASHQRAATHLELLVSTCCAPSARGHPSCAPRLDMLRAFSARPPISPSASRHHRAPTHPTPRRPRTEYRHPSATACSSSYPRLEHHARHAGALDSSIMIATKPPRVPIQRTALPRAAPLSEGRGRRRTPHRHPRTTTRHTTHEPRPLARWDRPPLIS